VYFGGIGEIRAPPLSSRRRPAEIAPIMLTAARLAFADIFSPPFRSVMVKALLLTLAALAAVWLMIQGLIVWLIDIQSYPWLEVAINILTGLGLLIGLGFLVAPVAALFAGLFTDEIAKEIEAIHYGSDAPGRDVPTLESLRDAAGFLATIILVNLIALIFLLVPFVGAFAFLAGNGYLLGREFFEAVARRYLSREEVRAVRLANRIKLFLAGLGIAGLMVIPILNLLTPLFATTFMLHLYKRTIRPVPRHLRDFDMEPPEART
jgi:CysZ protein